MIKVLIAIIVSKYLIEGSLTSPNINPKIISLEQTEWLGFKSIKNGYTNDKDFDYNKMKISDLSQIKMP